MINNELDKSFVVSIMIFFVSLIALILVSFFWGNFSNTDNVTGALEAISTAITAAGAISVGGYFTYQQFSETANTRYMDIADRLFDELNSQESIEARRRIFQNLKADPEEGIKRLKKEDQDAMKQVLNSLDRVAFLTREGWIPDKLIMPWMHPMIAKSWEKLEPYVLYERERRNEPYYYEHAGELAERCRKWRAKHLAETDTKWVDNAL